MYAKIFTQIFDSSIVEDPELRFTFMDLLVLADVNGVVDMTHEAISRRTNRPLDVILKTIKQLESPDPRSRTPDDNGIRIVRLDDHRDWGWEILNYQRFRELASEEQRREKTKLRLRKFRSNQQVATDVTHRNAAVTLSNDSPSTSPCTSSSHSVPGKGMQGKGGSGSLVILKKSLCSLFERPESDSWAYDEEYALAEVSRRPAAVEEMRTIQSHWIDLHPEDRRYFPSSIGRLLQNWTGILDKARTEKHRKSPSQKTLLDKETEANLRMIKRL